MRFRTPPWGLVSVCVVPACDGVLASAATIAVPAGGDLQAALNAAQPGDVITLAPGATYTGNFVLPNKGAITDYITVRSAAPDSSLPPPGVRMTPAYAAHAPEDQVVEQHVRAADGDGGEPLEADVPRVSGEPERLRRHHRARRRRLDADAALAGAVRARDRPRLRPRRSGARPETRHRAPQPRHHHHQLVHVGMQGDRPGLAGHRRLQRSGQLPDREQLPRRGDAKTSCSAAPIRRFPIW